MYVNVKTKTEKVLHICREPSARSWAVLFGIVSLGFGAAFYGTDLLIWKLAYICGTIFLGITFFEEWEDCIFDKEKQQIQVQKRTFIQHFFTSCSDSDSVVANMGDIVNVVVEEEKIHYGGKGYHVVLKFNVGFSLAVTQTCTTQDIREHQQLADLIKNYMDLDPAVEPADYAQPPVDGDVTPDSSSSDDSFERIDKADVLNEENVEL